jgi:ferric hydroxamate transport system ATP-binding protein
VNLNGIGELGSPISAIELTDVSVTIDGVHVLDGVSLVVPAAGVTGVIGQNGSGKSTLLKLLARQEKATGGQIVLEDQPLDTWKERAFARRVAYLPQEPPSAPGLTVAELVAFGRYPWHGALGRFSSTDAQKVEQAMMLTGTQSFRDRLLGTLSGGERQRCWLAMLLAQDARLLLLDEPISALDVAHQVRVLGLVRRISMERRLAVVLVIHDINLAARYCDHLVALKRGRLIAQGSPARFMTSAQLEAIYDVPMGVLHHPDTNEPFSFVRQRPDWEPSDA